MANKKTDTQPNTQPEERKPLPVPEGGWPADEFTGLDGRFVRDPYTGLRSRAPDDEQPQPTEGA